MSSHTTNTKLCCRFGSFGNRLLQKFKNFQLHTQLHSGNSHEGNILLNITLYASKISW